MNTLKEATIYFKHHILPYVYILNTSRGYIIITSSIVNFAHLTGIQHIPMLEKERLNPKLLSIVMESILWKVLMIQTI